MVWARDTVSFGGDGMEAQVPHDGLEGDCRAGAADALPGRTGAADALVGTPHA
jgi:hypothetical protein